MCPACLLTVGGGLLIAQKLGINNILALGLISLLISAVLDNLLRTINKGKVFFPFQRVVVALVILLTTILIAEFLL